MISYNGVIINPGFYLGRAKLISQKQYNIGVKSILEQDIGDEIVNLEKAISKSEREISAILENSTMGESDQEIIKTHLLILRDPEIIDSITTLITDELHSAANAVHHTFSAIVSRFMQMENEFFAQRMGDYKDVAHRLLSSLLGDHAEEIDHYSPSDIIVIKEISPSRVTGLAHLGVKAYLSEKGSYNSHSSILTRALNMVAITAVHGLMDNVRDGDELIVDAIQGKVIVNPDPQTIQQYQELISKYLNKQSSLRDLQDKAATTLDGKHIRLCLNLELPQELNAISGLGSDGIGLFRTEFLYLSRNELPTEEEQCAIYSEILGKIAPLPVTIRTFDLGGDKLSHLLHFTKEENPYLGCRGIRFSLEQRELFYTQIRAILRASISGNARIMFPMIIDMEDFRAAKALVTECMQDLQDQGIGYRADIKIGVMIEIPSAALCSDQLATAADFFSIGTNDLVQYTLAVDRNNENVAKYYVQHHPAVLNLIRMTLANAAMHDVPVSICGEMASMDEYIPLLLGMGITELSINPNHFLAAKAVIRKCDKTLSEMVSKWDFCGSVAEVESFIFNDLKAYYQ